MHLFRSILVVVVFLYGHLSFAGNVDWLRDPQYGLSEETIEFYEDIYYGALEDVGSLPDFHSRGDPYVDTKFCIQLAQDAGVTTGYYSPEYQARTFFEVYKNEDRSKPLIAKGEKVLRDLFGEDLPDLSKTYSPFGFIDHPVEIDSPFVRELQRSISLSSWKRPLEEMLENPENFLKVQNDLLERLPTLSEEEVGFFLDKILETPYATYSMWETNDLGGHHTIIKRHSLSQEESPLLPGIANLAFERLINSNDLDERSQAFDALVFNETYRTKALDAAAQLLLTDASDSFDLMLTSRYVNQILSLGVDERLLLNQELHESLALHMTDPSLPDFRNFIEKTSKKDGGYYLVNQLGLERVLEIMANDSSWEKSYVFDRIWLQSHRIVTGGMAQIPTLWNEDFSGLEEEEIRKSVLKEMIEYYDKTKNNVLLFHIGSSFGLGILSHEEQFEFLVKHEGDHESTMSFPLLTYYNPEFYNPEVLLPLLDKYADFLTEKTLVEIYDDLKDKTPKTIVTSLFFKTRRPILITALTSMVARGNKNPVIGFVRDHAARFNVTELLSMVEQIATFRNEEETFLWTDLVLRQIEKHPHLLEQLRTLMEQNPKSSSRINKIFSEVTPELWSKLVSTHLLPKTLEKLENAPHCPNGNVPILKVEHEKRELRRISISPNQRRHLVAHLHEVTGNSSSLNIFEKIIQLWTENCRTQVNKRYNAYTIPDEEGHASKIRELESVMYANMTQSILTDYWTPFAADLEDCQEPDCTNLITQKIKDLNWQIPETVARLEGQLPGSEEKEDTFPAACKGQDPLKLLNRALNTTP